jgi:prepilin-type N-terminal cleavage/methylation domain-containing protein
MLQNIKKRKEGFTIIEVLIVLAIAGLILLVVFLAVPALQRNSRNTSMKNDVQNVLGGISEYQNVNSGSMPTGVNGVGTVDYTGGTATSIKVQGSTRVETTTSAETDVASGTIRVRLGYKCAVGGGAPVANTRAVAAYYSLETTSGRVTQCQDS